MSDESGGGSRATGGMSPEGTTTKVPINKPALSGEDEKVICTAICTCKKMPLKSKTGADLKQICVSKQLAELDEILHHRSKYKAEVNYDMTKAPPVPIMDKNIPTRPHEFLPGWIKKHWKEDPQHPPFVKGTGQIRRPDVIIVKDPKKPPTQDNIEQVVEIKFPPQEADNVQAQADKRIAGDPKKAIVVGPEDCDCDNRKPGGGSKVPIEVVGAAGALGGLLVEILFGRGKGIGKIPWPKPQPAPVPVTP